MKIKQIEAILKASKTIAVIETPSCQWLSNGFAAYPIYNLPELTEENIFAMFDIPKDKQENSTSIDRKYRRICRLLIITLQTSLLTATYTQ